MAIAGAWKAQQTAPYVSELKQGTGVNPIHGSIYQPGRGIATHGNLDNVPDELLNDFQPDDYGYCDEDVSSTLFGYGVATGTAEHPSLGAEDFRSSTLPGWPSPGVHENGLPGGLMLRAMDNGQDITLTAKETQPESLLHEGYKLAGEVEDAITSDPSQYERQTSMQQRDKSREGSQAQEGRANADRSRITSRITGQRMQMFSDGYRHDEMEPRGQDVIIRPFPYRTAGTGFAGENWNDVNDMYVSDPITRELPGDPYTGPSEDQPINDETYMSEDILPYV